LFAFISNTCFVTFSSFVQSELCKYQSDTGSNSTSNCCCCYSLVVRITNRTTFKKTAFRNLDTNQSGAISLEPVCSSRQLVKLKMKNNAAIWPVWLALLVTSGFLLETVSGVRSSIKRRRSTATSNFDVPNRNNQQYMNTRSNSRYQPIEYDTSESSHTPNYVSILDLDSSLLERK
jgi:hypothetical protein